MGARSQTRNDFFLLFLLFLVEKERKIREEIHPFPLSLPQGRRKRMIQPGVRRSWMTDFFPFPIFL
jgi:hypothetical protein